MVVKVNVLSDRENIYLFWEVENSGDITAAIHQNDSALVGDDYVQVNLKPLIPDSIKYARDYSFSIAVNTNEAVWDAYFDPYHEGYFFTNWASNTQVKTIKRDQNYSMEMAIPFSDLDIYSDPGWAWNLTFNRAEAGSRKISTSSIGVSVIQNIKVRNPRMVGYYWPREEFWPDIIPDLKGIEKPKSRAGKLNTSPKKNRMRDDVWSDCEEISLCYDNKTTERIKGETAKARVGYDKNNLYILLLSPDPFPVKTTQDEKDTGEGMSRQLKGLDGVYRDLSVETSESFWILFQPGSIKGDAPHQDYYFITVDFAGNSTNIRYDSHGKPDKTWHSQVDADIFKTAKNWGIELTIPLIHLNIPHEYSSTWRMNVMYNIPKAEGSTIEGFSDIQAWYPTLKDERNPEKTGIVHALDMDYNTYVKRTFERRVNELSNDIISLKEVPENELNELKNELKAIRKEIKSGDAAKIKRQLEMLDVKMGIAEEKSLFINSPDIPNDGYPLNDVHFINPQKGFAVGALGLILQTEDGGETWEKQRSLTDCSLSELFFLNENEGWIAGGRIRSAETNETMSHDERGGDGIILYTKNGGESWEIQFAKRGTYLFDVFFTDSSHGWAVGEGGLLLRTTDGGKLWSHVPTTGTIKWLNGIYFFDRLSGILVGESETVLKTDDGGDTWEKVNAEADRKFYDFRSFYRDITFIGNKGWIVGQNGTILSSSDKGLTWEPQATEFDEKVRELMDLRKVFFLDEDRGYALGGLGSRMMKTDNGGVSWSMVHLPNTDQNHGGWFDSRGNGFLVGARSKILKTKDHAKSWITVNGSNKNIDLLVFTAHGDDSPIQHGFLMTYLSKIEKRDIAAIHVTRDTHSNEYKGEYYDYECDRSHHLMGVKTTMHFDEFDTGNSGSTSFHINLRLWKGYHEIERHMVAAIRAYRPDVVITHDPIFGEYDKPGHKIAGRAGFMAFYNSGIPDQFPELTRLGLKPHQPQKLYTYATQAFPATYEYESILEIPLEGYGENIEEWANRSLRCFQSQGIHFVKHTPLHLVKSFVEVPEEEGSIFEGL